MTHREACNQLAANSRLYTLRRISFARWSMEVDRILAARFPGDSFRRFKPRGGPVEVPTSLGSS
jgi:hypothetical protein